VKLLLQQGYNANTADYDKRTALMLAAGNGHKVCVYGGGGDVFWRGGGGGVVFSRGGGIFLQCFRTVCMVGVLVAV